MLFISIVTLLFTYNGISRIQAEEIQERTAGVHRRIIPNQEQPFQDGMPGDGGKIVLGAVTYQKGMTFNHDQMARPDGPIMSGAYTNHVNQTFNFVNYTGDIQYGSSSIQINNIYRNPIYPYHSKGAKNSNKPREYQSGQRETVKKSQIATESQAYSAGPNSSSKQLSLSFNKFCLYVLVVLFKYCLF